MNKAKLSALCAKARECAAPVYYVAEERAFAPGIVKEWPEHIPHPTDPNGRLTKLKHFPPAQESETRSGAANVDGGYIESADLDALIAEAKE